MSTHTTDTTHEKTSTDMLPSGHAGRRRLIVALTVLAFLAIGSFALYAISLIFTAVMLLMLSALLAYLNYPLVLFFQRRLPHPLAIAVAYLLVAGALAVIMVIVTSSLVQQSSALAHSIQFLLSPVGERQTRSFFGFLGKLGITTDQVAQLKNCLDKRYHPIFFFSVLPLDMVDNSTTLRERNSGWLYSHLTVQAGHFIL